MNSIKIDGRDIVKIIISDLTKQVKDLKKVGVTPTLGIILIGRNPASLAYIRQKQKIAEAIGGKVVLKRFKKDISEKEVRQAIEEYNNNPDINGIIIQLPLPKHLSSTRIVRMIELEKDVDGFRQNSPFTPPVVCAVLNILKKIYEQLASARLTQQDISNRIDAKSDFYHWLKRKRITIIGRGQSGGKPINETLKRMGSSPSIIHSQTTNRAKILHLSDIIISAVGKSRVVKVKDIKRGVILIGIGLHREDDASTNSRERLKTSKLAGDYDEKEISQKASFYTPTPGGVGPLNVACLWQNVIKSAHNKFPPVDLF